MPDEERRLWELSLDEKRILLVTFLGGVASIVVGAALIGVAIALARSQLRMPRNLIGMAIALPCAIFGVWYVGRPYSRRVLIGRNPWMRAVAVAFFALASVFILFWVGIAAGVK
jgi:hypothetical protein